MVKLSPAGRRWTSSRRFETSMPTKTGALSMTRFRWMRADQPWPPFGLRGHGRRGARYLPGLAGPMGKRAPAGLPDPDTYRIGSRQHTNGQVDVSVAYHFGPFGMSWVADFSMPPLPMVTPSCPAARAAIRERF